MQTDERTDALCSGVRTKAPAAARGSVASFCLPRRLAHSRRRTRSLIAARSMGRAKTRRRHTHQAELVSFAFVGCRTIRGRTGQRLPAGFSRSFASRNSSCFLRFLRAAKSRSGWLVGMMEGHIGLEGWMEGASGTPANPATAPAMDSAMDLVAAAAAIAVADMLSLQPELDVIVVGVERLRKRQLGRSNMPHCRPSWVASSPLRTPTHRSGSRGTLKAGRSIPCDRMRASRHRDQPAAPEDDQRCA